MSASAAAPHSRAEAVRFLARERWGRLVRSARAAGPDAEDAVQDVLERLAAGAGDPPADRERLTAYAAVAVRRRAVELAERRRPDAADHGEPVGDADPAGEVEVRQLLAAYTRALDAAPPPARKAVVLDAAGWSRGQVAAACGLSERTVKRLLETHRARVLAAAARTLDGTDCARLADTLAACATGGWRLRRDGPARAHLTVCPACRAALARARATRTALRALFPAPTGLAPPLSGVEGASIPLIAGALKAPWIVGLAVSAAVTTGVAGVAGVAPAGERPTPAVASAAAVAIPPPDGGPRTAEPRGAPRPRTSRVHSQDVDIAPARRPVSRTVPLDGPLGPLDPLDPPPRSAPAVPAPLQAAPGPSRTTPRSPGSEPPATPLQSSGTAAAAVRVSSAATRRGATLVPAALRSVTAPIAAPVQDEPCGGTGLC